MIVLSICRCSHSDPRSWHSVPSQAGFSDADMFQHTTRHKEVAAHLLASESVTIY